MPKILLCYLSAWSLYEVYSKCSIFVQAKRFVSLSSSINRLFYAPNVKWLWSYIFWKTSKVCRHSVIDKSDSFHNASFKPMILSHQYSLLLFRTHLKKKELRIDPKAKKISQTNGQFLSSFITYFYVIPYFHEFSPLLTYSKLLSIWPQFIAI